MSNRNAVSERYADVPLEQLFHDEPAMPSSRERTSLPSSIVGRLVEFDAAGYPIVDFAEGVVAEFVTARSIVPLRRDDLGREVVLSFQNGDATRPLILGVVQPPVASAETSTRSITADEELTLRCGKASLTLTKAGKVLIRGAYISSRSSGVNRVKGGSVQIN